MNATTTATNQIQAATAKVLPYRKPVKSSWITDIRYKNGFLAIFTKDERTGDVSALLYAGVPSWVAGLVKAGTGRRSPGLAFNRLVKSKGYAYQRIEGKKKVKELREMMK